MSAKVLITSDGIVNLPCEINSSQLLAEQSTPQAAIDARIRAVCTQVGAR